MDTCKYIVHQSPYGNQVATLFSAEIAHKQVALDLGVLATVVAAGFVRVNPNGVQVYGRSVGLACPARPEDAVLIAKMLGIRA